MLPSMSNDTFDVVVIGGGSAGYAAARTAADGDLRTAVIEGGPEVGGLCILRGCMPTKALLYASDVLHIARRSSTWGLSPGEIGFDFEAVMKRKDAMIADFAGYRREQLQDGPFQFIRSRARFIDGHTVELDDGRRVRGERFVVSVGSRVSDPPLAALGQIPYLTSDDALRLKRLPKSMIVLGGGAVAVEFAQFFARFDVKVTLVQRSGHIIRDFDGDVSGELEAVFRSEGMDVYTNTKLTDAWQSDGGVGVGFDHDGRAVRVEAERVLFALGRSPNTGSLDLDRAGVKTDRGRIITNSAMQTSVDHIFAAGDCASPHEIVHLAVEQGEIAAHNILHPGAKRHIDYRLLTSVVFTDPQAAMVGLNEKAARVEGVPFESASYRFDDHGKSLIMDATEGFVKLLADPGTGAILGGACLGPVGGELIHEIITAMHGNLTVGQLARMPHYHPTLSEIWTYPAEELAAKCGDASG